MNKKTSNYTLAEESIITTMRKDGKSYQKIADTLGRPVSSVYWFVQNKQNANKDTVSTTVPVEEIKKPVVEPTPVSEPKTKPMTYREMIKALWDAGYRIKNNKLVVVSEREVNLADIVKNG